MMDALSLLSAGLAACRTEFSGVGKAVGRALELSGPGFQAWLGHMLAG